MAVVTFESDKGDPGVWRGHIDVSEPGEAASRAVFRALTEVQPRKYESVVVVLERGRG